MLDWAWKPIRQPPRSPSTEVVTTTIAGSSSPRTASNERSVTTCSRLGGDLLEQGDDLLVVGGLLGLAARLAPRVEGVHGHDHYEVHGSGGEDERDDRREER